MVWVALRRTAVIQVEAQTTLVPVLLASAVAYSSSTKLIDTCPPAASAAAAACSSEISPLRSDVAASSICCCSFSTWARIRSAFLPSFSRSCVESYDVFTQRGDRSSKARRRSKPSHDHDLRLCTRSIVSEVEMFGNEFKFYDRMEGIFHCLCRRVLSAKP